MYFSRVLYHKIVIKSIYKDRYKNNYRTGGGVIYLVNLIDFR